MGASIFITLVVPAICTLFFNQDCVQEERMQQSEDKQYSSPLWTPMSVEPEEEYQDSSKPSSSRTTADLADTVKFNFTFISGMVAFFEISFLLVIKRMAAVLRLISFFFFAKSFARSEWRFLCRDGECKQYTSPRTHSQTQIFLERCLQNIHHFSRMSCFAGCLTRH